MGENRDLAVGQLVLLYPNINEDRVKGDVEVSLKLLVLTDFLDDLIIFQTEDGGRFFLHTPYKGQMIYAPTKYGKPIMLKKNLLGEYKFPKGGEWK